MILNLIEVSPRTSGQTWRKLGDAWKNTLTVTEELALSETKIFKMKFISLEVTHSEW